MMQSRMRGLTVLVLALSLSTAVKAADLMVIAPEVTPAKTLPAVSGINGKLDLSLGGLSDPEVGVIDLGGTLSVPVGDAFGLQADIGLRSSDGDVAWGGALHAFTRDPSSYLLGITAGVVKNDTATLAAVGPEAELYLGNISLEAWAGWAKAEYDSPSLADEEGAVFMGDIALYVTDDWRISAGVNSILGENSFSLDTEYQISGLPLSLTGEIRAYDDESYSAKIGLRGYFGGGDKSLIDRHRQDDPRNRVLDLFNANDTLSARAPVASDFDTERSCRNAGFYWDFGHDVCLDLPPP